MKLAVVGVTGMVGASLLKVLEEYKFEFDEFIPVASEKSVGKSVYLLGKEYKVVSLEQALEQKPDIAIFSAGKSVSLDWAPKFASNNCFVVDNSSAWRMDKDIPLIIPEVNISILENYNKIIANPNCSTIQLAVVLWALHLKYRLKRVVVSTYQSVTGTGHKGVNQLMSERAGKKPENMAYPHQIDLNCIPQGGEFLENDYTEEEMKLVYETRKILNLPELKLTSTVVRVPVLGGHSESVNIEFENKFDISELRDILEETDGVSLLDNPQKSIYPMPLTAENSNLIFVGRVRRDESCKNAVNMWIVADNLRKGAASNAVQIAQYICDNFIE
ncbi:MAG TPA: aspartate-semialdehyde dehydrogenase [Bacteroidales bacterium]|nr:aspartate-semialdehyde dehydrogenase [Bacteroidales bacterium]HQB22180.1 aspartate-semialdehyde dehydrogenase [Bacteroidales bacterium]